MKKVILNKCFGGFDVSVKGYQLYAKKKGRELFVYKAKDFNSFTRNMVYDFVENLKDEHSISYTYTTKNYGKGKNIELPDNAELLYLNSEYRTDKDLIEVVEELGAEASGRFGNLKVVEIPDDLDYVIDEYDGIETLHARVQEW